MSCLANFDQTDVKLTVKLQQQQMYKFLCKTKTRQKKVNRKNRRVITFKSQIYLVEELKKIKIKMVLEIKSIGCIEDLRKVPKFLGVEKGIYFNEINNTHSSSLVWFTIILDENWLNVVCYSLSTKCGTLAFAHQYKVIILSNQWDSTLQQYKYSCFFSGCLKKSPTPITSIHCLPITNEQKNVRYERRNMCFID